MGRSLQRLEWVNEQHLEWVSELMNVIYLFLEPPKSKQAITFLMSSLPKMDGAILREITSNTSAWDDNLLNSSSSSAVKWILPELLPAPTVSTWTPTTRRYGFLIPIPPSLSCSKYQIKSLSKSQNSSSPYNKHSKEFEVSQKNYKHLKSYS